MKIFFNDSYEFLENLVEKENIIYAEIHYDEDTPHMRFYFLSVVNQVRRKVFKTDKDSNLIKHKIIGKDGNKKLLFIQKKDTDGKNMFTIEKGKFLNCNQFWKELKDKAFFAKIQNDHNKFITDKGYKLFIGNIGDNVDHKIINEKNGIIESLEKSLEELADKFKEFKKNISIFYNKICKALVHKLGIHFREDDEINYERPKKDKSDDFEISM